MFFRIFQHLLPKARAWAITANKQLREFVEGLSAGVGDDPKEFFDDLNDDLRPQTTRQLDEWDFQFGLSDVGLSEQARRDRIAAAWKALGGQDPRYIEDTLRDNGFDVYLHEWWEPGTEPAIGVQGAATPRNPLLVLRDDFTGVEPAVDCGEPFAECGESFAECGNSSTPLGYPLVNKLLITQKNITVGCGDPLTESGEPQMECGNFDGFTDLTLNYTIPAVPAVWPFFLYIGAETYPNIAQVDLNRKNEFEELCLKICPAQQWLGILVQYI